MKADRPEPQAVDPGRLATFGAEFNHLYRMLQRHGVSATDAEDLAQEAFVIMCRRWDDYDHQRPLRHWLSGIAFKLAQAHHRRSGREVVVDGASLLSVVPDEQPVADQHLDEAQARALVLRALASLPENHRAMLVMSDLDEVPMREIARTMSVPLKTAYTRLRTARLALAKTLREMQPQWALVPLAARPDATALLAVERPPPPAPPLVRRRALERARTAQATGLGTAPSLATVLGRGTRTWVAAAIGVAAALMVAGVALIPRAPAPVLAASGAGDLLGVGKATPVARTPAVAVARRSILVAAPVGVTSSSEPAAPLGRGLIGYWRFDDGYGSVVARDLSGHGNDCVLRRLDPGSDWIDGRLGGALSFDGRGWLECPRSDAFAALAGELTVSLWVKRLRAARGLRALVSRQLGSGNQDHFQLGLDGTFVEFSSHLLKGLLDRPLPPALGAWVHLAAVRSEDGRARLFVDGVEVGQRRSVGRSYGGGSAPVLIGAAINGPDASSASELYEGAMDEVLIYNRALADAEIEALAAGVPPRPAP